MKKSKISWTSITWNPTTGCTKISAGCRECYSCPMSIRLKAMGQIKYKNGFRLTVHPSLIELPYLWKKPCLVFVNSMSDLFHIDVPIEFILEVFRVMNDTPQHTYQILTKRHELLSKYDSEGLLNWSDNICMGVSVEDKDNISRIDSLRKIGAKTKFLSCEPLLSALPNLNLNGIDWVIAGAESGPKARQMQEEWAIDIRNQCSNSGIPFFFKQFGKAKYNPNQNDPTIMKEHPEHAKGGCMLKGKIYHEMPKSMEKIVK